MLQLNGNLIIFYNKGEAVNDFCCIADENEWAIHVLAFMCSSLYSYMYLYILNNCKSLGEGCSFVRFSSYLNAPAWTWEYRNERLDGGVKVAHNLQFFFLTLRCDNKRSFFPLNSNAYSVLPLSVNTDKYNLLKYIPQSPTLLSFYVAYYMRQLLRHCYKAGQQIIQAKLLFAHTGKD